ncbi:MAG: FAD-linked oxidase C-terminal domain-containing protein, partial [Planctomycetota bacterium]
ICTAEGRLVEIDNAGGFDLAGVVCGSEGTLGLVVEVVAKLTPIRTAFRTIVATFGSQADACDAVGDIVGAGHLPAAMEMLDGRMVKVVEDIFHLGIDPAAEAMLLIELDDPAPILDRACDEVCDLLRGRDALTVETASDAARKAELWTARKKAFGAIGRISPSYCTQDACVPRSKLAEVLAKVDEIGKRRGLSINNVFHAGDGNVHPIFLYDDRNQAEIDNVLIAAEEVLQACIDAGGTITGEHGVGLEKLTMMPRLFDDATLEAFRSTKRAFDPGGRFNSGKLLPAVGEAMQKPTSPGRKVPQ